MPHLTGGPQGPTTVPATKSLLIEGVNSLITVQISDYPLQLVVSNWWGRGHFGCEDTLMRILHGRINITQIRIIFVYIWFFFKRKFKYYIWLDVFTLFITFPPTSLSSHDIPMPPKYVNNKYNAGRVLGCSRKKSDIYPNKFNDWNDTFVCVTPGETAAAHLS